MSAECEKCGTDLVGTQWDEGGLSCVPCDLRAENARLQATVESLRAALKDAMAFGVVESNERDGYKALAERRGEALKRFGPLIYEGLKGRQICSYCQAGGETAEGIVHYVHCIQIAGAAALAARID